MKIAVGMSGGVDSSVTAYVLKQQGHEVFGLTMQIWDGTIPIKDEGRSGCFGPGEVQDIKAAQGVCARLGIPLHVINLAQEYKAQVLAYFRSEYLAGRTPNPCVRCNQTMKFGLLLQKALQAGHEFDRFATGHYARMAYDSARSRYVIRRGLDETKDQSYFLSFLNQEQLSRLLFPLGDLKKEKVKEIAREIGWDDMADKPESQDFIETSNYSVLFEPGDAKPGSIIRENGDCVGTHNGVINYTVGQRKGLGGGSTEPMYVTGIDCKNNLVKVGTQKDLYARRFRATGLQWHVYGQCPTEPVRLKAKIRQQHKAANATVVASLQDGSQDVVVEFDEAQRSITPGQIVAFYDEDLLVCGGTIAEVLGSSLPGTAN